MKAFQKQDWAALEPRSIEALDGLPAVAPRAVLATERPRQRRRSAEGLTRAVLRHLPFAVAVVEADARLMYWNEQAAALFNAPPMVAQDRPELAAMLVRIASLAQPQRDRLATFVKAHIAAGDRVEPNECLRMSVGRASRLAVQVYGLGTKRWLIILDEGRMNAAASPAVAAGGDAWLDSLTGLHNRRHFAAVLQEALEHRIPNQPQAILLIDLDGFAPVNETHGHAVGDSLLCLVARRLRRETRDDDVLARLGGDTFAILMPNGDQAEALAERTIQILTQSFQVSGHLVQISASVGIARSPEQLISAEDLMHRADLALAEAKRAGGRAWRTFEEKAGLQSPARDSEHARRTVGTGLETGQGAPEQ